MTTYKENPKTKGSGIVCAIPQTGECPNGCADCFFQSGRSYLEPLAENLPNMPSDRLAQGLVVRVNDGNDSNVERDMVVSSTERYPMRFFNTAIPKLDFPDPVVLTVNPGEMTDVDFYRVHEPPPNLMFVRVRTNTWNLRKVVDPAVEFYTTRGVPVMLTFMAYFHEMIPADQRPNYKFRKRTLNSYWAITTAAWEHVMEWHQSSSWVYSCGKIEGERGTTACARCGNCLREFFAAKARMGGKA